MKKRFSFSVLLLLAVCACKSHGSDSTIQNPPPQNAKDTGCPAGVIFCSGFEETNWRAQWDDYDGNPETINTLVENPGPFNSKGNHVMRMRVPAGTGGADIIKVFPQKYDRVYARWYEYWEPGYDFSARNHGGGLFAGDRNYLGQDAHRPSGADFASAWVCSGE